MEKMSPDEIRALLDYDPNTGLLRWRVKRSPRAPAGSIAGSRKRDGHGGLQVEILGKAYMAHDLAWICATGAYPEGRIGHRDLDRFNNRLANLFDVGLTEKGFDLSQERLRKLLDYDAETGVFAWRLARGVTPGATDCTNGYGYTVIRVDGTLYRAHRLAWLYHYGRWPAGHLDHINGVRSDNRIANLREATPTQNAGNSRMSRHNTSGYRGVVFDGRKERWRAQISIKDRPTFLGYFATKEEAAEAYMKAARDHFGDFCPTPSQAQAKTAES